MKKSIVKKLINAGHYDLALEVMKADRLPGGLADDKNIEDFDLDALNQGIEVEMEHTDDKELAREIAMDHLTEDPEYYTKLKFIEN